MKKIRFFLLIILLGPLSLSAQTISGDWNGLLEAPGIKLRLVFHVEEKAGALSATMDSPDQGAFGIPVTSVTFTSPLLRIQIAALLLEFSGTLNDKGEEIAGTFKQGGASFPLKLQRRAIEAPAAPKRPQEPKLPLPYYTEEVSFENPEAGLVLAGTLALPRKEGKFPVAILVSGSGPQNRDEELMGHKPFLVLSDFLVREGFGVLRYDDRGVGKSTGNFEAATSSDFASDARAAITFLQTRKEVLPNRIGVIGHSEGGMIAPMVAEKAGKDLSFIVSLAGTGVPGEVLLLRQQELIGKSVGMSTEELDKTRSFNQKAYQAIKANISRDSADKVLFADFIALLPPELPKNQQDVAFSRTMATLFSPWFRFFVQFNPGTVWEKVKCPVLALNGEKDLQVDPVQNLPAIEAALKKAKNKDVTVRIFPGLNHLFQHAESGAVEEYEKIEETFAPEVLQAIAAWLKARM